MTKDELTSVLGGWEGYSIENIERQDASNGEPAQVWLTLEPITRLNPSKVKP